MGENCLSDNGSLLLRESTVIQDPGRDFRACLLMGNAGFILPMLPDIVKQGCTVNQFPVNIKSLLHGYDCTDPRFIQKMCHVMAAKYPIFFR